MTNPNPPATDLCYPVLTPFKFQGVVIKPPTFIQLSEDEAAPYIAANVLGADGVERPEDAEVVTSNPDTSTAGDTDTAGNAAAAGAAAPAAKAAKKTARVVRKPAARKG